MNRRAFAAAAAAACCQRGRALRRRLLRESSAKHHRFLRASCHTGLCLLCLSPPWAVPQGLPAMRGRPDLQRRAGHDVRRHGDTSPLRQVARKSLCLPAPF